MAFTKTEKICISTMLALGALFLLAAFTI